MGSLFAAMVLTRGKFIEFYAEFDMTLPTLTEFALSQTALAIVTLMFMATIAKEFTRKNRMARIWNIMACLLTLVEAAAYVLATLWLPFVGIMPHLSSGGV